MNHSNELLKEITFNSYNELYNEWNIEERPARNVNNELQRYTRDSFLFKNNILTILTNKCGHEITSGRINSRNKFEFQYGYIEALIKFDPVKGLWPAFWLLGNDQGWPNCGEIDILEYVGWNRNKVYGTLHGPGYCGGNAYGSGPQHLLHNENDWNTYAVEWNPNCIKWFINDNLFFTASRDELHQKHNGCHWVFNDRPHYIIFNTAVGGNFGGAFHDSENYIYNNLPHRNETSIKYIRLYKTKEGHGHITRNH